MRREEIRRRRFFFQAEDGIRDVDSLRLPTLSEDGSLGRRFFRVWLHLAKFRKVSGASRDRGKSPVHREAGPVHREEGAMPDRRAGAFRRRDAELVWCGVRKDEIGEEGRRAGMKLPVFFGGGHRRQGVVPASSSGEKRVLVEGKRGFPEPVVCFG